MDGILKIIFSACLCFGVLPVIYDTPKQLANEWKDQNENELYKIVEKNLSNFEEQFYFQYIGDTSDLEKVIQRTMDRMKENHIYVYENISKWQAKYTYSSINATLEFNIVYLTNKEQEEFVDSQIPLIAATIEAEYESDYEKIKAVHDYAVLNTKYSEETDASQYTTYALLQEGKAVCQGYALFVYRVLEELNIPVKYVKGYAGDILHGWNLVRLDGNWYHIDATWDDPLPNKENRVRYKYFLLSDETIQATHSWVKQDYPSANSTIYEKNKKSRLVSLNRQSFWIHVKEI